MCYTAILKVNCKRCLAMGYGDVEHIDYKHCKEPCSRPYTITGRPSDTTPERYHCEICLPAFYEPAGDDIKKVYITRCRRPDSENSRIPDWSAASVYLVTKQYCAMQGGVSMDLNHLAEEATTVQEQLHYFFKDFGTPYALGGRPLREIILKEMGENWELVKKETQWPRESTCEEVEEDWMLVEAGVMSHA